MNFIRNHFANLLTLGNLFSGCVGIINLISGNYEITAICIIVSLVLDFFDGFVARILKSDSDLGVQLDSLADMISFGFLPGMVMYKALEPFGNEISGIYLPFDLKYFGFLITVFSALRLAIFNVDTEQKYYFKGLNTPTNTILIFGYFYVCKVLGQYSFLMINPVFLLIFILISSWLLISPIKMISLKFQSKKLKDNYPKIALLIGIILILIFFKTAGIPLAVIYYILISLIFQKKLGKS
ncbi:MAG: CDP-alcohol phosphatidyltransferase family protein [Flavobacteriaceae bacterium]|jgi:CDP-diacylglycerol--serine O-phosphatidyltransferase|nr:CDP-alcohol phosphatidyltransferase family protein [Flavobacteriaceae bacterium]